jgi:transcriptional regulator with XRE-family HTH domain
VNRDRSQKNMPNKRSKNFIGPHLRALRTKQRCTQSQLARRLQDLGLPTNLSGVSRIECRRQKFLADHLPFWAEALDVPLAALFKPFDRILKLKNKRAASDRIADRMNRRQKS